MSDIVLTADRALMTDYNGITPLGSLGCFPDRLLPNFFINILFRKLKQGQATYALRRVEAKLLDEGFKVEILRPQEINKIKKIKPKIVGISTVDPLTQKPDSWTLSTTFGGGKSVIEQEFFKLLYKINKLRETQKFKIIIGGPGSTEFENDSGKYQDLFDSIIIGPAEGAIDFFNKALNEETLPKKFFAKSINLDDLSIIKGAARNGHVQITQGCPRKCKFCGPCLVKWISFPKERILKEIEINIKSGIKQISLITEDIFLYGSKDVEVNQKAIINLMKSIDKIREKYDISSINISDVSIASTIKGKKACEKTSEIFGFSKEHPLYIITGVETGSEIIIKKYMEGKPKPFNPNNWYELVKEGINILNDNYWYPVCSLMIGLPGEKEEDIIKTINLVDDLKQNKLFYFISYFVPISGCELENKNFYSFNEITEREWELSYKCWMHTLKSVNETLNQINSRLLRFALKKLINEINRELKNYEKDPIRMRNTLSSVNLKGLSLFKFIGQKFITPTF